MYSVTVIYYDLIGGSKHMRNWLAVSKYSVSNKVDEERESGEVVVVGCGGGVEGRRGGCLCLPGTSLAFREGGGGF